MKTVPCRAQDPETCKYHGRIIKAEREMELALRNGDAIAYGRAQAELAEALQQDDNDEVAAFFAPKPATEPMTTQQVMELPINSEATDTDGSTWRKTNGGSWQQIQADGSLGDVKRNSRYFALENKPTLKSMPEGAVATPHYQPGYPKQVAWQSLQPGDQISGGKIVSVKQTTTASKVNVTIERADGTTKTFAATKYNKQTVVGNADTAPVFAQHDLDYRLSQAGISLDERIQFGLGRAANFTYTVGGTATSVHNQVETPARRVYNELADSLLRSATLEQVEGNDYIGGWGVDRDRLLSTLESARNFGRTSGNLANLNYDQLEEIDRAHRYAFRILTDRYGTVVSRGGQQNRVQLRKLLGTLDKAYWEQPAPSFETAR